MLQASLLGVTGQGVEIQFLSELKPMPLAFLLL